MRLNLYRRHTTCKAGRPQSEFTTETEERKKDYNDDRAAGLPRRCECGIYVSGTLAKKFKRVSTSENEWDAARVVALRYEAAGTWDIGPVVPPPVRALTPEVLAPISDLPVERAKPKTEVDRAVESFVNRIERTRKFGTVKKYKWVLKKLTRFAFNRGISSLSQWTPLDVRELTESWNITHLTTVKNLSSVKSFFGWCMTEGLDLKTNPAKIKIDRPISNDYDDDDSGDGHQLSEPFTDSEIEAMFTAAHTLYGKGLVERNRAWGNKGVFDIGQVKRTWTGQDLADFMAISIYTGLRISDVATFKADRLQPDGRIRLRTIKSGKRTLVCVAIPEELQARIRARIATRGKYIFGEHTTKDLNVVTDVWRRKLLKLWALCGLWPKNEKGEYLEGVIPPTPHRFRHTFARIQLTAGVSPAGVARLLGNSEAIVLKHYSTWVEERQAILDAEVQRGLASFGGRFIKGLLAG